MERERSPNYPAYSLESCVGYARMIWGKVRRNAGGLEILAKALGVNAVSGPVRSKIGALRQYGLLDGRGNALRLTDRAMALAVRKPGDPEYDEAVRAAALAPGLFATLAERADNDDDALRWHLMQTLKFSEDGAKRAVRSFRETMAFAKLGANDYTQGNEESAPEDTFLSASVTGSVTRPVATPGRPGAPAPQASNDLVLSIPGVLTARVAFASGSPTKQGITTFMSFLELMKNSYPDASGASTLQVDPFGLKEEPKE